MKSVKFEHGSEIEVESDGEEFKGYLDSVDVSFDYNDEIDAVQMGTFYADSVSVGYSPEIEELQEISGVGKTKAKALHREGYKTVNDVIRASQSELSDIDEIGNALAARIKADVGWTEDFNIDAEELIRELNGETDKQRSFLDEGTLMVNMYE